MKPALLLLPAMILTPGLVRAEEWKLAPITGHNPDVWAAAPNWSWVQKNPREERGATWSLWAQPDKDPSLTSAYVPMEAGRAFGYFFVWRSGDNKNEPQYSYRDTILATRALDGTPQAGPAAVLRFKVPSDGEYHLEFAGTTEVQNPTAGHSRLTAYTLSADGTKAEQLSQWDLNADKPGAFGKFPNAVSYARSVSLKKGDELAVRLQTVNPGAASAGNSSIRFSSFNVTRAEH